MRISAIVATTPSGVIGNNGHIPWFLPPDLKRFKHLTLNHAVIMGRKTYQSLVRPLVQRFNIVVTKTPTFERAEATVTATSLEAALDLAKTHNEVFIAGGQQLYEKALPLCQRLYLTIINKEFLGDTFFTWSPLDWTVVEQENLEYRDLKYINFIMERKCYQS